MAGIQGLEEEEGEFLFVFVFELYFAPGFSLLRETHQFCLSLPASPQGAFWNLREIGAFAL